MWEEIAPGEFITLLSNDALETTQIIDVREKHEWDYYHLEESTLLPMNEIPSKLHLLRTDKPLYIVCAHGVRSAVVCNYLQEKGYDNLRNVSGGMAAIADLQGFAYD
ncbi:rhodanese-related sulfurtransferase [Paenibacillus phyllosphaerae]|uniref:Rhodanese-related sulfurtransferase n=1 Tax=Paenibacillus phyllosphaerae TaxID=274593 RepID=A0A7W5AVX0_9BACL|nr:rhodanese-like domain-containing protein [Paenibacillus phyllosphaerae]MBB3109246.1 rhodanese-related sulfurtransferase [Paenibacillus phyllosphaerae]